MAGSVHKRMLSSGKIVWQARLRVRDGERWRTRSEHFPTQREGRAALLRWQTEDASQPPPSAWTLAQFLTYWLEHVKRHAVRPSTLREYTWRVQHEIIPYLGSIPIKDLSATTIQEWESTYKDRVRQRGGAMSARSVRYTDSLLRQALAHAVATQLIPMHPMIGVVPPKRDPATHTTWEQAEIDRFRTAAAGSYYQHLWTLALYSGMRIGEILALRWSDVDFAAGTLHIARGAVRAMDDQAPKTASGVRTITLGAQTVAALHLQHAEVARRELRWGKRWQGTDLVFPSRSGRTLNPENLRRNLTGLIAEAQVTTIRIHDLRHTNATIAIEAGVPVTTMSDRLGHADVRTTLSIYVRRTRNAEAAAAQTIETLMQPGVQHAQ